jgi:pimeloyl-ACP methyl ester carboxylesterase
MKKVRTMAKVKIEKGHFKNGIPFIKFGNAERILASFAGGPGNEMPSNLMLRMMMKSFEPFTEDYTVYMMTRKSNLPSGYSTRDMSEDYATVIRDELGCPVDVIGTSYGGLIAQHLGADHPELVRRLVLALAACKVSDAGKELDTQVARFQSQGKWAKAYATAVSGMYQRGIKKYLFMLLMHLFFIAKRKKPAHPNDPLIEAEAEANHDTKERLVEIKAPTLVIGGDNDFFSPAQLYRETAAGIPNAKLILYKESGHNAGFDMRLNKDILAFLRE